MLSDTHLHSIKWKQGKLHGYPSGVGVGKDSDEIGFPSIWAETELQKPSLNTVEAKCQGPSDKPA